jgi:hypothetical protein
MAKRQGKKMNPKSDPHVRLLKDRDGADCYLQDDGAVIAYYPDGTEIRYANVSRIR